MTTKELKPPKLGVYAKRRAQAERKGLLREIQGSQSIGELATLSDIANTEETKEALPQSPDA